ncbi:MAG: hypothetical protein JO283_16445 [Bradyrhizobium sp.]|nr:hypothetical protein [Bradyrhizobium sp.]
MSAPKRLSSLADATGAALRPTYEPARHGHGIVHDGGRDQARPDGALDPRPAQDRGPFGKEGAGVKSLGEPWADTTACARLMLTVLSGHRIV